MFMLDDLKEPIKFNTDAYILIIIFFNYTILIKIYVIFIDM